MTLLKLKWAYQRARYGIDERIRHGYGLEEHFELLVPEIKKFCMYELSEYHAGENCDKERAIIFAKTWNLIRIWETESKNIGSPKEREALKTLYVYISEHLGYYWN